MAENGLDARQKGDLYWRKLKRYLVSKERFGDAENGDKDTILAKDIFAHAKGVTADDVVGKKVLITGDEFKVMPPTATGNEIFGNKIILVIKYLKYFNSLLENAGSSDVSETDKIVYSGLSELTAVMKKALDAYFCWSGIDFETGEAVSPERRREAEKTHVEIFNEYRNTVKDFRKKVSLSIVESLTKDMEEAVPDEETVSAYCDGAFKRLEELDHGMYDFNRADMEGLKGEYKEILLKEASLEANLLAVEKYLSEKTASKSDNSLFSLDIALEEYGAYVEEERKKLEFEKSCCYAYARFIIIDDMIDPVSADFIFERWGERVNTFPTDVPICTLPEYEGIEYDPETSFDPLNSLEEIKKYSDELTAYRNNHPDTFESQTITSLFFGTEKLPVMEKKAGYLRNSIATFTGDGFVRKLLEPERAELRRMWIEADAFVTVAAQVLDYAMLNKNRTIKELIPDLSDYTFEMSYARQLKMSALALANAAERGDK